MLECGCSCGGGGYLSQADPEARRVIYKLCLTWGFIVSSWAAIGATAPLLLKDIVGSADAAWWQGVFTATTAVSGALFCMALGYLSDKAGRLAMLLPWITAFFLSTVCVVYADVTRSVWFLWAARLPALAVPSAITFAFASDVVHGKEVLEAHGLLGATFGISLLLGSVMCGVLGRYVSRFAALCGASLLATCAAFVAASTIVPPTNAILSPNGGSPSSSGSARSFIDAARVVQKDPLLRLLIVAFALLRVCNVNSYFMFVLFTNFRLGWQTFDAAIALGLVGSLGVLWQLFGLKYIVQTHDNVVPFLLFSLAINPITMIGYGVATTSAGMYCVVILGSVSGIAASILTAKISVLAAECGAAGMALGLVGSVQNVVEIFASLMFGEVLAWSMRTYSPEDIGLGTPYFINAAAYACVIVLVCVAHFRYGTSRLQWVGHHDERQHGA
jgi:MFS transporter, DHA1 family, tetracycline resistance protein